VGGREAGGVVQRMLGLDWGSAGMGRVEVLVEERYGLRLVERHLTHEDGSRFDLFMALGVSGAWVRRCGMHQPAACAFWATRPYDEPPYVPRAPRVGSAIYIPGLKFALPLLPDIDLDDLRQLGLPMPFLEVEDLRRGALPSWLPSDDGLTLLGWDSEGPLPPHLGAYLPISDGLDGPSRLARQSVRSKQP
jgi:hypothetical protein